MPALDWIGKKKVVNHHLDVPFRILEKKYTYSAETGSVVEPAETTSENKIIHGDNLEALKSLLPEYEGKIKCIYIDPPYNTGNEGWIYNDNVNDPRIKKWLGEVVGKESEDFTRHDKWLCMMYPRLKLLQKLLSQDGAIFISIDDNEQANLKLICDEIFGSGNFVANIACINNPKGRSDDKYVATAHEYILIYRKSPLTELSGFEPDEVITKRYSKTDENNRLYREIDLRKTGENDLREDRPNLFYYFYYNKETKDFFPSRDEIVPTGYIQIKPVRADGREGNWRWGLDTAKAFINKIIPKYMSVRNIWGVMEKDYLDERDKVKPTSAWTFKDVNSERGTEAFINLGFDKMNFTKPKPVGTIERILQIATDKDSIILDSFAGSGTTAHAVLNMNKRDGGNRKFILIEMMDYAETITAERVKRVIRGYGKIMSHGFESANAASLNRKETPSGVSNPCGNIEYEHPGTGGSFSFYEPGEPLLINNLLNENIDVQTIREYIFFTETGNAQGIVGAAEPLRNEVKQCSDSGTPKSPTAACGGCARNENKYFLGNNLGAAYWFYYEKEKATTLDIDFLSTIKGKYDQYIIYADICLIPQELLQKNNIIFKKIPRDIKKF